MLCYITLYSLSNLLPKHSSFSSQTSNYNKRLRLAKESLVNLTGEGATGIELFALQILLKIRVLKKLDDRKFHEMPSVGGGSYI